MAIKYYLYRDIEPKLYDGDVVSCAEDMAKFFHENENEEIELHINSMGGDVYEGEAMVSAIKNHQKKVTAFIDGIAASTASFVALACDAVKMARRAEIFIHKAHTCAYGNADDFELTAKDLRKSDEKIVEIYKSRAKSKDTDFLTMMVADNFGTTLSGEEAAAVWNIELFDKEPKVLTDTKNKKLAEKFNLYKPKQQKITDVKSDIDMNLFLTLN